MQSKLQALANVGSVRVSRLADVDNGFQWWITFASDTGDLPQLTADL